MATATATTGYEVLVPEYTAHQQIGEFTDSEGKRTGAQLGQGKVYLRGDLIPEAKLDPTVLDALEDENHPSHEYVTKRLKKTTRGADGTELREPFPGYADMDEDDILAAMKVLPSATLTALREFEAANEGREAIVTYNIGFGESPVQRQEGKVGGTRAEPAEGKRVADLKTRNVPDEGPVEPGEGVTGTGDPQVAHFAETDEQDDDGPKGRARSRRGRRPRAQASSDEGTGEGGSAESSGD